MNTGHLGSCHLIVRFLQEAVICQAFKLRLSRKVDLQINSCACYADQHQCATQASPRPSCADLGHIYHISVQYVEELTVDRPILHLRAYQVKHNPEQTSCCWAQAKHLALCTRNIQ